MKRNITSTPRGRGQGLATQVLAVSMVFVFGFQASGAAAALRAQGHAPVVASGAADAGPQLRSRPPRAISHRTRVAREVHSLLERARSSLRAAEPGAHTEVQLSEARLALQEAHRKSDAYFKGLPTEPESVQGAAIERALQASARLATALEGAESPGTRAASAARIALAELDAVLEPRTPPAAPSPLHLPVRPLERRARAQRLAPPDQSSAATFGPAAATTGPPLPEDLQDGVDARQCASVVALASSLGDDPTRLYEFVRQNIDYTPYYGLRKGSCETLDSLSGNSFDQASLLVALLRASGIAARFVTGTVEITAEQAKSLMAVDDAALASAMIQTSAIPAVSLLGPGNEIVAVRMERAWVSAYVPYGNYRGVPNSDLDPTWIPLDPAMKAFSYTPAIDVEAVTGLDIAVFNATMAAASTVDPIAGQVVTMDKAVLDAEVGTIGQNLNDYLDATFGVDAATASDVLGSKVVVPLDLGVLPASLPYSVVAELTEGAALPSSLRYQLTLQVEDAIYSAPMAEIAGKRLTVDYPPQGAGAPPDIFTAIPTVRLDGQAVASGSPISTGEFVSVRLAYSAPNQALEQIFNTRESGELLAVVLDLGRMTPDQMQAASGAMDAAVGDLERSEWLLTLVGRTYFSELDANIETSAALTEMVFLHEVFGAIVSESRNTELLFGIPVSTEYVGINIDVDRQLLTPFSRTGDPEGPRRFLLSAGLSSSAMEHSVFNHLMDMPAVSTARILDLANQAAVPVYRIDSSNAATIIPLLNQSAAIVSTINSEIAVGRVITIPRDPVNHFSWSGTGYISEDPATGAAGYIISGDLSGQISSIAGGDIAEIFACIGAIVQIIDLIPIPGHVGVAFDILALPAGLYDVSRADVAPWRKALATVFVFISLLGIIAAIPTPPTILIGVLADVLSYAAVWALLGGGNPLDPCFGARNRRRYGPRLQP